MRRIKVLIVTLMTALLMLIPVNAYALTESAHHTSTAATAGTYHSEVAYSVSSSTLSVICGGDCGAYFYVPSVGLNASFVQSTSRTATVRVFETDSGLNNMHARTYTGTFHYSHGLYHPDIWSITYSNSAVIEGDSTPELFLSWKIDTIAGDISTSVPAKLLHYTFWVY